MVIAGLDAVDWSAPWFAPLAAAADGLSTSDWRVELNRRAANAGIVTARGHRVRFIEADAAGVPYELQIARTGGVPTRANLHDFFNALIWLSWPLTKARLNELQAAAIERDGIRARRGPLRDAATLVDENGVVLATGDAGFADALRARNWHDVFIARRTAWCTVRIVVLGHALLAKLVRPYKAIAAHTIVLRDASAAADGAIDAAVAVWLDQDLAPEHLTPLPVAGIPGWNADNANPAYYDDAAVFRLRVR